ncbi:hypothetical protein M569_09184, partial [Genlisea aurea]
PPTPKPTMPVVRAPRTGIATRCIAAVVGLVVLLGLIALITWLAIDPKKLEYSLVSGYVTGFNVTGDRLVTADVDYVLRATNWNRHISVYYDRIEATTSFKGRLLSINEVRPFHQPKRNVTHLDLDLAPRDVGLDGKVLRELKAGRDSGRVVLDVKIHAKIRLKVGAFKIHRHIWVVCGPATTPFSPAKGFVKVDCD